MLERSQAIKCPSIAYQLAASKRVQAALASPGQLDRFLTTDATPEIQSVLTSQYKLEMVCVCAYVCPEKQYKLEMVCVCVYVCPEKRN